MMSSAKISKIKIAKAKISQAKSFAKPQHLAKSASLLPTERSAFYQTWVLTNLTSKPFTALYSGRFRLSLIEWRGMLTIADRPGITAQALADYTGLDKMSVSRLVRSLEAQGRLLREASEADRRMFHLSLTPEGWAVYSEIAQTARTHEKHIFAELTGQELKSLRHLLTKLSSSARRWSLK